jgi:branched-subunit amino acid ABC-type transport system permease component
MERLAYRPLRNSSRIAALITAVGVSFLLENLGIIAFGANPKSYEPKTLGVYQIELAAGPEFADAVDYEVVEKTQLKVPRALFDGTIYARSRVVARTGASDWGPALEIPADGPATGFVELPPLSVPGQTQRPASIGYAVERDDGRDIVALTWARARSSDIALKPVFADERGLPRAFVLSVAGTPVRVPYLNMVILTSTLVVLGLLNLLINRSLFGISMRALSFDLSAAKLMGVNTDSVIALTFAIGGACAALAGNLVGMYNQTIEPLMGILPGLKAFVAAVVGGIGSIPGAAVGGLIMGLSESLVKTFIPPRYSALSDALAFALLIAVLLIKPTGIFGRAHKEKV